MVTSVMACQGSRPRQGTALVSVPRAGISDCDRRRFYPRPHSAHVFGTFRICRSEYVSRTLRDDRVGVTMTGGATGSAIHCASCSTPSIAPALLSVLEVDSPEIDPSMAVEFLLVFHMLQT